MPQLDIRMDATTTGNRPRLRLGIYELVLQEVANYQLAIVPIHDRFNEHLLIQPTI
jgi:hypothetical protein